MRVIRWIGIVLGVLALAVLALVIGVRFADGPVAVLPGGPLQSGDWVEARDVDFGFATDIEEVELESGGRSRTTWLLVSDREAYVPASLDFPPGKSWHTDALEEPAAVLRVDGRRYRRDLVRVDDEALRARLGELALGKYGPGPSGGDVSRVWFFHLAPRGR